MKDFDEAFADIIGVEKGRVVDAGGLTMYGISQHAYPSEDIERMTLERAKVLYKRDYWDKCRCEELPWPLSLFVFDCAVNQGASVPVPLLQKAVGTIADGVIGNNTLAAIKRADQKEMCAMFMALRCLRYTGTRGFDVSGKGWFKRLFIIAMEA